VVAADDVRVIELGHHAGFALEAVDKLFVVNQVASQYFEGDIAVEADLPGFEDRTHAPLAKFLQYREVADDDGL
jgi:hypothetical protein